MPEVRNVHVVEAQDYIINRFFFRSRELSESYTDTAKLRFAPYTLSIRQRIFNSVKLIRDQ